MNKHKINKKFVNSTSPIIVEVGCHCGEDTSMFRECFPHAVIYGFEPDPRNIYVLEKYFSHCNIHLFPMAVSNKNEKDVDFFQSYSHENINRMLKKYKWIRKDDFISLKLNRSGASSLKRGHQAVKNADLIKVDTVTLDSWSESYNVNHIDILWIDVQGAEKEVIDGAKNILKNTHYIWIEYGEVDYQGGMSRRETVSCLKSNFRVIEKYSSNKQKSKGDLFLENIYL